MNPARVIQLVPRGRIEEHKIFITRYRLHLQRSYGALILQAITPALKRGLATQEYHLITKISLSDDTSLLCSDSVCLSSVTNHSCANSILNQKSLQEK